MSRSPKKTRSSGRALLAAGVSAGVIVAGLGSGSTTVAQAATPPAPAKPVTAVITGHGWGHGRGMGQWGALGYAVNYGWSSARILNHFYGGTSAKYVGNPSISVELTRYQSRPVTFTGKGLKVNGKYLDGYIRVNRVGANQIRIYRSTSCNGTFRPWSTPSSVTVTPTAGDLASAVQVCSGTFTRGFRGSLRFIDGGGTFRTINVLPVESYLKGVVPRESPSSWGYLAGGRGMEELKAQAVAARSYALSSRRWYSTTCDTTACQVYGGWFETSSGSLKMLEQETSSQAVDATRGLVRAWPNGSIVRTEFSSSTGGYTAGGDFPTVRDLGDAVAGNSNHNWSTTMSWASLQSQLRVGTIRSIGVYSRVASGSALTRVKQVKIVRDDGSVVMLPGDTVRTRLGLRSSWFAIGTKLG